MLSRFFDGVEGPLSSYVRSCKPDDLDEAYSVSIEYTNASYRKKLENTTTDERRRKKCASEAPSTSYTYRKNNQSDKNRSNKFKNKVWQDKNKNDDTSMRTLTRNNTETENKADENELDELNFHGCAKTAGHLKNNKCLPYLKNFTTKGILKLLINTGANKNYVSLYFISR